MNNWKLTAVLVLTVFNLGLLAFQQFQARAYSRIGVVQMEELVYSYAGMQEASQQYALQLSQWRAQADSLEKRMVGLTEEIKADSLSGNKKEVTSKKGQLLNIQRSYLSYRQKVNEQATEQDQAMTVGILNQLNAYIKDYAQQKGYDLIIANTQMQNVAFATNTRDVTADLLAYANQRYQYGE